MAQRIEIEIADDGATSVTVMMDGGDPQMMEFASTDEAMDALEQLLAGDEAMDDEAMWNEEAAARDSESTPMMEEMM
jgi:hypothetical protein